MDGDKFKVMEKMNDKEKLRNNSKLVLTLKSSESKKNTRNEDFYRSGNLEKPTLKDKKSSKR